MLPWTTDTGSFPRSDALNCGENDCQVPGSNLHRLSVMLAHKHRAPGKQQLVGLAVQTRCTAPGAPFPGDGCRPSLGVHCLASHHTEHCKHELRFNKIIFFTV